METRLENNFKYLTQIIEGYYNNPVEYTICRKKRLLLLHNFGEIKDIPFLQDLFEKFVREHIYLILVKDFRGKSMLEYCPITTRKWVLRYHELEEFNDLLRENKSVTQHDFPLELYNEKSKIFRKNLNISNLSCFDYIVIIPKFEQITLTR